MHRRQFLQSGMQSLIYGRLWPVATASSILMACSSHPQKITGSQAAQKARIVVVGGGYAGATVAKYLKLWGNPAPEVIVIEPNPYFISCPLSNLVLGGSQTIQDLSFSYSALRDKHAIQWVNDKVTSVDVKQKRVRLTRSEISYDRLVIAPGIQFMDTESVKMASHASLLHAWKAGEQTVALRKQLEAMPEGGVFVMTIPLAPYRCPPGPYERACQVASYFKQSKPRSKVIILDANPEIVSKKGLFTNVFKTEYAGIIEYKPNSAVTNISQESISTEFETLRFDVLNYIPPQKAGVVAEMAGVVNEQERWAAVNFVDYQSERVSDVHVIGDAVQAALPKSAHMASSQAKVCASAILASLDDTLPDPEPVFANTCYSFINAKQAMHVANVYRYDPFKRMMLAAEGGGVSQVPSLEEGQDALHWAHAIWSDTLT